MTALKKIGAVVGGVVVAAIIIVIFEWINHFVFPLPADLNQTDTAAVQAFTASLPWTAYILVFVGWAVGAFEGGCTTTWLAGDTRFRTSAALAVILILAGAFDMIVLGFPTPALVLGLLILAIFPYLGHGTLLWFEAKKRREIAQKTA